MNGFKEFQTRTAYTVLTGIITNTIRKLPRFKNVPEDRIVADAFSCIKAEVNKK